MKTSFLLATLALSFGTLHAQAEPGTAAGPSLEEIRPTGTIVKGQSTRQMVNTFLGEKGWTQGFNASRACYIVAGYGDIPIPPTHESYMDARVIAFEKAMLDAKTKMAEFMEQTIATAAENRLLKTPAAKAATAEDLMAQAIATMPEQSTLGKVIRLVHAKLDNALRAEGVDPTAGEQDAEAAREKALAKLETLKSSDEFRRTVKSAAACAISGLQAFHTVEAWDGKKGSIGVVAIWSPMLSEMAASMVTGSAVCQIKAKCPIAQQLPTEEKVLLSSFGVQQLIDETGNLVLVSYGQSNAEDEDDQLDIDIAYDQAKLQAQGRIRDFAGESVAVGKEMITATVNLKFRDGGTPEYANESSYASFRRAAAATMACNGIQTLREWEAVHPLTGRTVYGVTCTWSPRQADFARSMKGTRGGTRFTGAAGRRTPPNAASAGAGRNADGRKDASTLQNGGATGDGDAF